MNTTEETPPRAWGRLSLPTCVIVVHGNTPTCVGKTPTARASTSSQEKHPHVRGEDQRTTAPMELVAETPPRAWGRHNRPISTSLVMRNTPTCVGKTEAEVVEGVPPWKHPHVRGEDAFFYGSSSPSLETPPRAWGRLEARNPASSGMRNTPTCVGKTITARKRCSKLQKHPHVRGEDLRSSAARRIVIETPPRAWGRLMVSCPLRASRGNTPTCVGKTYFSHIRGLHKEKHPHVRGEDKPRLTKTLKNIETPPRAWGRQDVHEEKTRCHGNTPTCVGKTLEVDNVIAHVEKHPHVRGEDKFVSVT